MLIHPKIKSWDNLLSSLKIEPQKIQKSDLDTLKQWCCNNIDSTRTLKDLNEIKELFASYLMLNSKDLHAVVNPKSSYQLTVLHEAAKLGFDSFIASCLQNYKEQDKKNLLKQGRLTPLHHAALHGKVTVLKVLLEEGADPNQASQTNLLPIHSAATLTQHSVPHEKIGCIKLLWSQMNKETKSQVLTTEKPSLFLLLVGLTDHLHLIQEMLSLNKKLVNLTDPQGRNALHLALINKRPQLTAHFLTFKEFITTTNDASNIAHLACQCADEASIELVISQHPELFHQKNNGFMTPIDYLAQRIDLSEKLIDKVHQIPKPSLSTPKL